MEEIMEDTHKDDSDIGVMPEACLDNAKHKIRDKIKKIATQCHKCVDVQLVGSSMSSVHNCKPGGVLTIAQDQLQDESFHETMTRWEDGSNSN